MGANTKHYFRTGVEYKGKVHKMPNGKIQLVQHTLHHQNL